MIFICYKVHAIRMKMIRNTTYLACPHQKLCETPQNESSDPKYCIKHSDNICLIQIDYLFAHTRVHADGFSYGALACGMVRGCHPNLTRFLLFRVVTAFPFVTSVFDHVFESFRPSVIPSEAPGVTFLCFLCLGIQEQLF